MILTNLPESAKYAKGSDPLGITPMAVPVLSAGKRLGKASGWTLTNLQMQKVCYISHMFYMGRNDGDALVRGQFEAWPWGPVHPDLYHALKGFGSDPIQGRAFIGCPDVPANSLMEKYLDEAATRLPRNRLISITHWKDGAWAKNYRPDERGIKIPNTDIIEEYRKRANVQ